jgi:hypothetical protein
MWPAVGCDAQVQVEYVLAPVDPDVARPRGNFAWAARILRINCISGFPRHSTACIEAAPLRPPQLDLHPLAVKQVQRLLRLGVPPAEILADNVRMVRDSYGGRPIFEGKRIYMENQVYTRVVWFMWLILSVRTGGITMFYVCTGKSSPRQFA